MKRAFPIAAIAVFALLVTVGGYLAYKHKEREWIFYENAFRQIREGGDSMAMMTIDFESGESAYVILEHSCCSGAGFDAVAVRTSDGREYTSNKNYCGLEGFDVGDAKDLEGFQALLIADGYRPK